MNAVKSSRTIHKRYFAYASCGDPNCCEDWLYTDDLDCAKDWCDKQKSVHWAMFAQVFENLKVIYESGD